MAGASGELFHCPDHAELIELPEGSELFVLPGRLPVGIEPDTGEPALLDADPIPGKQTYPLLPPLWLRPIQLCIQLLIRAKKKLRSFPCLPTQQ